MSLETIINEAWENKEAINPTISGELRNTIEQVLSQLDSVNGWRKKPTADG